MATVTKRLCLPVGSYKVGDKEKTEYREIGVEIEFEDRDGNKWSEVKLNADVLNPSLLMMARQMMERGSSTCRVKKFDVARRTKTPDTAGEESGEYDADNAPY